MSKELQNHNYCEKAITLKESIEGNFLELGEYLYNIKENQLYSPSWNSFAEFCWELKMSSNMVNKFIQIYKTFVLGYSFSKDQLVTAGGWTVLQEILPMVTSRKEALHWLSEASTLRRGDLRKSIMESKTGVEMSECEHKRTYTVEICKNCGEKRQIINKSLNPF